MYREICDSKTLATKLQALLLPSPHLSDSLVRMPPCVMPLSVVGPNPWSVNRRCLTTSAAPPRRGPEGDPGLLRGEEWKLRPSFPRGLL